MPARQHLVRALPKRPVWVVGALLALGLAVGAALPGAPSDGGALPAAELSRAKSGSDITIVQANLPMRLPVPRFHADRDAIMAQQPDFVTYNEVNGRDPAVLAPAGYALHRSTRDRYTAATPVAWRTDRWSLVDSGTRRISNFRKIPPGKKTRLGLRYVNWVTLVSAEGRRLSVVSAHLAPPLRWKKKVVDLSRPSMARLARLVEQLAPQGPVLVGGDFNFALRGARYPSDVIQGAALVSTYDSLGTSFTTKGRYAIDFAFARGEGQLQATRHRALKLNSDHHGVVAGYDWLTDAPAESTTVVSPRAPEGTKAEQRAVLRLVTSTIKQAEPGTTIELATAQLGNTVTIRRIRWALRRGVHVRVLTRSPGFNQREQNLDRTMAAHGDAASGIALCSRECRRVWRRKGAPATLLLHSDAQGRPIVRIDVNRVLSTSLLAKRSTARTSVGEIALTQAQALLRTARSR